MIPSYDTITLTSQYYIVNRSPSAIQTQVFAITRQEDKSLPQQGQYCYYLLRYNYSNQTIFVVLKMVLTMEYVYYRIHKIDNIEHLSAYLLLFLLQDLDFLCHSEYILLTYYTLIQMRLNIFVILEACGEI